MLVSSKSILKKAQSGRYAVGAFNVYNIETLQAVIRAAEKMRSPVIIQTSKSAIEYAGLEALSGIIKSSAHGAKIPVALHLDHGKSMKLIKNCLKAGYTSIMFDGSLLPFEKNIKETKKVVNLARRYGASVEAELGILGGKEESIKNKEKIYTNPQQALVFTKKTGIDALAVSIGTAHGIFKKQAKHLRFDILKEIRKKVSIPLVLHGASLIDSALIKKARKAGIKIKKAQGISQKDIKKAIGLGICKINIDTDLRLAFTSAMRAYAKKHPSDFNPRDVLRSAEKSAEQSVMKHIKLFGSAGKA